MNVDNLHIQTVFTVVTIVSSVGAGYLLSVLIERRKKKQTITYILKSLMPELEGANKILNGIKYPTVKFEDNDINKPHIQRLSVHIPILDNILLSGDFRLLDLELQQRLSYVKELGDQHNRDSEKIMGMIYLHRNNLSTNLVDDYVEKLDFNLRELHIKVAELIRYLKENYL